jgi:hypothetical protein
VRSVCAEPAVRQNLLDRDRHPGVILPFRRG